MTHQNNITPARLALSTGTVFTGRGFGATGQNIATTGEVVFNTSMTGYQESLTDPSYMGQILIQTQPMIGNTGVNREDTESDRIQVAGFGVHEYTENWSNYRGNRSLDEYLSDSGILAIADLDTRALTRNLRSQGVVQGVLTDRADLSDSQLVEMAKKIRTMSGQNLAMAAGASESSNWTEKLGQWGGNSPEGAESDDQDAFSPTVLVMDFGIKSNIARNLTEHGCRVEIIPQSFTKGLIKNRFQSGKAHALFLSNGPGDPDAVKETVQMLKELIADSELAGFPIFGICLGHQLLSLAMGAKTYKLPFGHRGANHPVHDLEMNRIQITSQNHGFAVDEESMRKAGGVITHIHLNDGTVAGFRHPTRPIAAVQFHPEASPGPHDAALFFDRFVARIKASLNQSTPA